MNRTDRLYALVEELRRAAPRPRTSKELAARFEVSVRTIERDLSALQQSGVPIWATSGPGGGYTLDPAMTMPALNFTPAEALAMALALSRSGPMPFAGEARTALQKLLGAMSSPSAGAVRDLADRVRLLLPPDQRPTSAERSRTTATSTGTGLRPGVLRVVEQAVIDRQVLDLAYEDGNGVTSSRVVEPVGFIGNEERWYLVAWCRLREDGRSFRLDRIHRARPTGETASPRPFETVSRDVIDIVRPIPLAE